MADIVPINPRLKISDWGLERVMPFFVAKAVLTVASLPLAINQSNPLTPRERSCQ